MYSLNEIDSTAKRAARGIGLSWGMAEEVGKAARWLEGRGHAGVRLTALHLRQIDGRDHRLMYPQMLGAQWCAADGDLCPIATGVTLSDLARELDRPIKLGAMAFPMLMLSHLALVAKQRGQAMQVSWPNAVFIVSNAGAVEGAAADVSRADWVAVDSIAMDVPVCVVKRPDHIDPKDWATLEGLGHRIFAPNTEHSRTAGAGAADDGAD